MERIRLLTALILLALVLGGFVFDGAWLRLAPLALSTIWAVVEIVRERRRRSTASDPTSRPS
jgi:hypothetical protein